MSSCIVRVSPPQPPHLRFGAFPYDSGGRHPSSSSSPTPPACRPLHAPTVPNPTFPSGVYSACLVYKIPPLSGTFFFFYLQPPFPFIETRAWMFGDYYPSPRFAEKVPFGISVLSCVSRGTGPSEPPTFFGFVSLRFFFF